MFDVHVPPCFELRLCAVRSRQITGHMAELSQAVHYAPDVWCEKSGDCMYARHKKFLPVQMIMLAGKIEMAIGEGLARFFCSP